MGRLLTVLAMAFMIGSCATGNQATSKPALPNDIQDRQIEEERRSSNVTENAQQEAEEEEVELAFDWQAYQQAEAERRAVLVASLPPSPEGIHTWVLESVDMVTCGREGISMYCVETNAEPDGFSFTCSDEEAESILAWFGWNEDDGERRDFSRVVNKPFHVPTDIEKPSEALNYLLFNVKKKGEYRRPSVEDVRSKLVEAFAALEIPNIYDDSTDAARWRQTLQPLFWENLPKDLKDWGMPATTNEAFLAFQRDVRARGDIAVSIMFQSWGRESSDYFVVLQNERGVEAAAHIDRWSGDLKRCRVANNTILEIDWDWYRSQDDEDQGRGGR